MSGSKAEGAPARKTARARGARLSPLERKEIARRAATARWGKKAGKAAAASKHPYAALEPREAVLVAAAKTFAVHGYEEPSLNEIAAAAGVGLQTIYRFFPAKRTLYLDVCAALQAQQMAYYADLIRGNATPEEKVYGLALGVSHTHVHPHLIRLQHWKLLDPSSQLIKGAADDYWSSHYADYIAAVAQMGVSNPERAVLILIGSIVGSSQFITVMGDMALVKNILADAEGVARFSLENTFPDRDWAAVRPQVKFIDFNLDWIGRPPAPFAP